MSFLLLIGDKPQSIPLQVGTEGCSKPFPGWSACRGCVHEHSTDRMALPALHVTWVQGASEPELVCLHREVNVPPESGIAQTGLLGGVEDTTPLNRVGAA
jgi:hypothetical protein